MKELNEYRHFMKKEELHKSLNSLVGILSGIVSDGIITEAEQNEVENWYSLHEHLMDTHPFSEILPIIHEVFSDNILDIDEAENIIWLCNKFLNINQNNLYFDLITSKIQQLESILHGIMADGILSGEEISTLENWMDDNDYLSGTYPFDEVYSLILAAKEDGKISSDENNMLKAFFSTFIDTRESFNLNCNDIKELQKNYSIGGICATCPEINIDGKTFCFTGASKKATRNEIANIICEKGGSYNDNVTQKTDYLIVGADGNPCWAFSCYGRKVEKAVNLRKEGKHIIIVHEYDFWDEIN
ncbi:MAG: NAD-dependent DNA ligase [Ruminococcaceae bacterium]|nr:NAD-dependent DNA ligase [Oscillospiraceae bacterium]